MAMRIPAPYPFDPSGALASNKVLHEQQIITYRNHKDFHFIVPTFAPFFEEGFVLRYHETGTATPVVLVKGKDYYLTHKFNLGSLSTAKPIYGSITFLNRGMQGVVDYDYQVLGGDWLIDDRTIQKILADRLHNPRTAYWDQVAELPYRFPVTNHDFNVKDLYGAKEIVNAILNVANEITIKQSHPYELHLSDYNNPHKVTKRQVGLGNVANLSILPEDRLEDESDGFYITPKSLKGVLDNRVLPQVEQNTTELTALSNQVRVLMQSGVSQNVINQLIAYFDANPIGNASRLEGRSVSDLKSEILSSNINAATLNNRTIGQITNDIVSQIGTPQITDDQINNIIDRVKQDIGSNQNSGDPNQGGISGGNAETLGGKSLQDIQLMVTEATVQNATKFNGYSANEYINYVKSSIRRDFISTSLFQGNLNKEVEKTGYLIPLFTQLILINNTANVEREEVKIKIDGFSIPFKNGGINNLDTNTLSNSILSGFDTLDGQNKPMEYYDSLSKYGFNNTIVNIKLKTKVTDNVLVKIDTPFLYSRNKLFNTRDFLGVPNADYGGIYVRERDSDIGKDPDTQEVKYKEITYYFYVRSHYKEGKLTLVRSSGNNGSMGSAGDLVDLSSQDTQLSDFRKLNDAELVFANITDQTSDDADTMLQRQIDTLISRIRTVGQNVAGLSNNIRDAISRADAANDGIAELLPYLKNGVHYGGNDITSTHDGNYFVITEAKDLSVLSTDSDQKAKRISIYTTFAIFKESVHMSNSKVKVFVKSNLTNEYTEYTDNTIPQLMLDTTKFVFDLTVVGDTIQCVL